MASPKHHPIQLGVVGNQPNAKRNRIAVAEINDKPTVKLGYRIIYTYGYNDKEDYSVFKEYTVDKSFSWDKVRKYFDIHQSRLRTAIRKAGTELNDCKINFMIQETEPSQNAVKLTDKNMTELLQSQMSETYKKINDCIIFPVKRNGKNIPTAGYTPEYNNILTDTPESEK